jgi:uncharacterized membrane protein YGL010W
VSAASPWLDLYAAGHEHPTNRALHWVCAPLLTVSFVGALSSLPVPAAIAELSPVVDWGTLFLMAAVVYYFIMSITLAFGTLPFVVGLVATIVWLKQAGAPLLLLSTSGLLLAAIGQHLGHRIEGGRATLMRDLHYIAIAPLWALAALYRKLGIPY